VADGSWFRAYFDERVIALYQARIDPAATRGEVGAILELLGLQLGARVLDVGCGWGRHAVPLAEAGMEVTGIDISEAALREGDQAAREAGVHVRWVDGEMREMTFSSEFDAALSLFSSLGYFLSDEEDLRVLRAVRRALRPGGTFLLETMHRGSFPSDAHSSESWDDHDGDPVQVERSFDPVTGVNRERLTWPDSVVKEHAMRIRTLEEWEMLMAEAGFAVQVVHGGWEGEPFDDDAPVLLMLATPSS